MEEVLVKHIEQLLEMLSKKTKQPLDSRGFAEMSGLISEEIGKKIEITKKYLYESLYRKCAEVKKKKGTRFRMQHGKLDALAKFLGYDSFRQLVEHFEKPIDPILRGCLGSYYCYVRMSNEKEMLLRSPVRILAEGNEVIFELTGGKWHFEGPVRLAEGTLFILMKSSSGKEFHHVYRIGKREEPALLRGMFTGVSTSFDVIGGRTVLIRQKENFSKLKIAQLDMSDLRKSESLEDRRLAEYFEVFEKNNLRIQGTPYFSLDDLGKCK